MIGTAYPDNILATVNKVDIVVTRYDYWSVGCNVSKQMPMK